MNPELLAALSRERRRAVRDEFAKGELIVIIWRALAARTLRASGEGLFRLGVALDERVSSIPVAETHV